MKLIILLPAIVLTMVSTQKMAVADTYPFSASVTASGTITTTNIPNVTYSVALNSPFLTPFTEFSTDTSFNVVADSNNQSHSWANGILSDTFAPVSASAAAGSSVGVVQAYLDSITIVNSNNYLVRVPLLESFSYSLSASSAAAWSGFTTGGAGASAQMSILNPNSFLSSGFGASCGSGPVGITGCETNVEITWPEITTVLPGAPMMSGVFSNMAYEDVPANSDLNLEIYAESSVVINGPVPEPGTLTLLGTGLLGILAVVRRRFHMRG